MVDPGQLICPFGGRRGRPRIKVVRSTEEHALPVVDRAVGFTPVLSELRPGGRRAADPHRREYVPRRCTSPVPQRTDNVRFALLKRPRHSLSRQGCGDQHRTLVRLTSWRLAVPLGVSISGTIRDGYYSLFLVSSSADTAMTSRLLNSP